MKKILLPLVPLMLLFLPTVAFAHPGNTDSQGGHYCWTNCASWGLDYGEYHFHEEKSSFGGIELYYDTMEFVEKTKSDVNSIQARWGSDAFCDDTTLEDMAKTGFQSLKSQTSMLADLKKIPEFHYCEDDFECSTNVKYIGDSNTLLAGLIGWLAATSDYNCGTNLKDELIADYLLYIEEETGIKVTVPKAEPIKSQTKSSVKSKSKKQTITSKSFTTKVSKYACTSKPCKCEKGFKVSGNKWCIKSKKK